MKQLFYNYKILLLAIPVISLIMHFHVFRLDLVGYHVWRQTETQTVINNFSRDDINILNPRINDEVFTDRIFRMEFPVMQWIFALFCKLFGHNVLVTRILTFITGLFSVYGIYYLIRNIFKDPLVALIGAWTFNFSPIFYYYTVNPLPDNFALCCAVWSLVFFFKWINHSRFRFIFFSAVFLCLATLSKLPFILYATVILVYIILLRRSEKQLAFRKIAGIVITYFLFLIPVIGWYVWVIPGWHRNGIISGLSHSSKTFYEILDIMQGNLVSTLPELLINYCSLPFFLAGIYFTIKNKLFRKHQFPLFLFWGISIILYFLFEMNMIEKTHDYYLFPFLPLIFLLVSYGAFTLLKMNRIIVKIVTILLVLILPVTAYLRSDPRWNINEPGFNADFYQYKNELRNLAPADALCVVGNDDSHFIMLYYVDKKGWTFSHDDLSAELLKYLILNGAKYLYTDSKIDTISGIRKMLKDKLFDKHDIRVYSLKLIHKDN